jgi:hypothetical protein
MLKLPRISPAGVIATGALFLSLGGGAALAATAIDGHTVTDRSLPGVKIVKHTVGSNELKQPTLHIVGTPGAAPFQNKWQAPAPTDHQAAPGYEKDASGIVHLRGEARYPGASDTTIFTLPPGYRPAGEAIIPVAVGYHLTANVEIDANGDVHMNDLFGGVVLDGVSFVAGG